MNLSEEPFFTSEIDTQCWQGGGRARFYPSPPSTPPLWLIPALGHLILLESVFSHSPAPIQAPSAPPCPLLHPLALSPELRLVGHSHPTAARKSSKAQIWCPNTSVAPQCPPWPMRPCLTLWVHFFVFFFSGFISKVPCGHIFFYILLLILSKLQSLKPSFPSHPLHMLFLMSGIAFSAPFCLLHSSTSFRSQLRCLLLQEAFLDPPDRSDVPQPPPLQPWPLWVITVWGQVCPSHQTVSPRGQSLGCLGYCWVSTLPSTGQALSWSLQSVS